MFVMWKKYGVKMIYKRLPQIITMSFQSWDTLLATPRCVTRGCCCTFTSTAAKNAKVDEVTPYSVRYLNSCLKTNISESENPVKIVPLHIDIRYCFVAINKSDYEREKIVQNSQCLINLSSFYIHNGCQKQYSNKYGPTLAYLRSLKVLQSTIFYCYGIIFLCLSRSHAGLRGNGSEINGKVNWILYKSIEFEITLLQHTSYVIQMFRGFVFDDGAAKMKSTEVRSYLPSQRLNHRTDFKE